MSKQGAISIIVVMSSTLLMSITYNACSKDANFNAPAGFDQVELPSDNTVEAPLAAPNPTIKINNDAAYTRDANVNLTLGTGIPMKEMFVSNSDDCSTGQWQDFQENIPWTLSSTNSEASVYVMYRTESDEDPTPCVEDKIIHDDIPPVVTINSQTINGWLAVEDYNVTFEATDNLSGIKILWCAKDGSGVFKTCSGFLSYLNMIENQDYKLEVQAIDEAGNKSPVMPLDWKVDLTPPTVSFNLTPSPITADTTPDFAYVGIDTGSGVNGYECKLDAAPAYVACPNTQTLSGLADGQHTLSVRAIDNVGRISDPISYNWVQDSAAPTVMFVQTPDAITNDPNAQFVFQGLDGGVPINMFECSLDGGAYVQCNSPHDIANLADGNHSFSVRGRDNAGNMSAPITYNWLIDTGLPTIAFVETPDPITNEVNANFQISVQDNAGGSGIDRNECRLDAGNYQPCNVAFSYNNLAEGNHVVMARTIDRAGNVSPVVSYNWVIDTTKPTVQIVSTPDNPTNEVDANFEFNGNDVGSGIESYQCRIDGGSYGNCNSPQTYSGLTEGTHNFYVRAIDRAGNISDPATYVWEIDLTGPTIAFAIQPDPTVFIGDQARILFRIEDTSGVDSYTCAYNGQAYACTVDVELQIPANAIGDYEFTVMAVDGVGNSSTESITWSVTYDIVAKSTDYSVDDDRPVDVLFVVDNSGSMNAERANLAQRIAGFVDKIEDLDWQIAIISTDVRTSGSANRDGRFVELIGMGGEYILDSSMDKQTAQQIFGDTVQGFGSGSGAEQGIWATKRAIDRFVSGEAIHQQFFRDGAHLSVIVLSDEDENSRGVNIQISPSDFLSYVSQTWNSTKNLTWHSIIARPGDTGCLGSQPGGPHYAGVVYSELSNLTGFGQPGGAIIGSVCENDYTSQLADIGQSVKDMQKTITLECEPVDTDNDSVVDIEVGYKPQGAANYQPYAGANTVQGVKLVFDDFLPPGDFKVDYSCVAN